MSDSILTHFEEIKSRGLSIDITRGKPDASQLDLANELLKMDIEPFDSDIDLRNYGEPFGIADARELGSEILCAPQENIITGEQSSLLLSYQMLLAKFLFDNPMPWKDIDNPKFICTVPGFDRHFTMFEDLGINMIPVPLVEDGVDIKKLEEVLNSNINIMGIICVPRHSNPSGEVYSDQNMNRLFSIGRAYSDNFLFLFDHAYLVHDFLPTREQTPAWKLAEDNEVEHQTVVVTSFSKVTFGGGGLSFAAAGTKLFDLLSKQRASMIVCSDKVNQLRHLGLLKNKAEVENHMKKHADLVRPKFEAAFNALDAMSPDIGNYKKPTGGYFISFNASKPIAKRVIELCKEAGVLITPAGSTYPHFHDPQDSNIRLAPTFLGLDDLKEAMEVFTTALKIAFEE